MKRSFSALSLWIWIGSFAVMYLMHPMQLTSSVYAIEPPEEAPSKVDLSKDPNWYYRSAQKLVSEGLYGEALKAVNQTLKLNPDDWQARYLGAYIYQLQRRNPEAIAKYRELLEVKPDHVEARTNLGVLLKESGKINEAKEQFKKAISLHFYTFQPHYNLANVLIEEGKWADAGKELRICLKLQPSNAWPHNNLGVVLQKMDYLEEAAAEFKKASNLEPSNPRFIQNFNYVNDLLKEKIRRRILGD